MNRAFLLLCLTLVLSVTLGCGGSSGSSSTNNPTATTPSFAITNVSPTMAGYATTLTITGYGFGQVQSSNSVTYNGVAVTPTGWNNTTITVVPPQDAQSGGSFNVIINGALSNTSNPVTLNEPRITSISPSPVVPGSTVTISGQYLGTAQPAGAYVTFNGLQASNYTWSENSIQCTVPSTVTQTSGTGISVVVYGINRHNTTPYSATLAGPTIAGVTPNADNIGAEIVLTGQNFGTTPGTVTIGGNTAVVTRTWADTQLYVRVPSGLSADPQSIVVTSGGRASTPYTGFRVSAPTFTLSQIPATKNQTISITGSHFGATATEGPGSVQLIRTDSSDAPWSPTSVSWSDNQLSFTCGVGPSVFGTQRWNIVVTVGGISSTLPAVVSSPLL